jgi:hypothetical protein
MACELIIRPESGPTTLLGIPEGTALRGECRSNLKPHKSSRIYDCRRDSVGNWIHLAPCFNINVTRARTFETTLNHIIFEVSTAVTMKNTAFSDKETQFIP